MSTAGRMATEKAFYYTAVTLLLHDVFTWMSTAGRMATKNTPVHPA
jgi:hypothetical protein